MCIRTTRGGGRHVRRSVAVAFLSLSVLVVACGGGPPSASPSSVPTPVVTPDPHLPDPTTADDVFRAIGAAGLRLTPNNAVTGDGGLIKRINASYGGWPLSISEYTSAAVLADRTEWAADEMPGAGEPAVAVAGSNILITWGPMTNGAPVAPDAARAARLVLLAEALDALLGPLRYRSLVVLPVTTPAPPSAAPSAQPEATP